MRRLGVLLLLSSLIIPACTGSQEGSTTTTTAAPTTTAPTTTTTTLPPTPQTAEEAGLSWWNDRVFYEVFVRSFSDSDGDGNGDLAGLTERLDYLNDGDPSTDDDLGITGIWLMPVFESPSYHGYDVTDYRRIEPDYGTLDDFRGFLDAAHERGIAVIVDLVLNHTSRRHPWFAESYAGDPEYEDWYLWADQDPGWSGPVGQQVWHPIGERWYYGLFWDGMPDLNLENTVVTAEMRDIARFWLEDVGVDGFRLDAAKHLIEVGTRQEHTAATLAWLVGFKDSVASVTPDALVLGEVWDPPVLAGAYVPEALDLTFDFDLAAGILLAIEAGTTSPIERAMEDVLEHYPHAGYAAFLSNHDQERVMSRLNTVPKAKVAAALLLTSPGVPFVYYGEEVGLRGTKPDENIRTPMPWTDEEPGVGFTAWIPWEPARPGYPTANVATQTGDPESLLWFYRELIRVRDGHPALRYGEFLPVESGSGAVYSYLRTVGDDHVLVVVNLSRLASPAYSLELPSGPFEGTVTAAALIGPDAAAPRIGPSGGFSGYRPVDELGPREVLILTLSEE